MNTVESKIEDQKAFLQGTAKATKGVVKEQVGNLTQDNRMRLSGKKDQIEGHLQAEYGASWRRNKWLILSMTVAVSATVLSLILLKRR